MKGAKFREIVDDYKQLCNVTANKRNSLIVVAERLLLSHGPSRDKMSTSLPSSVESQGHNAIRRNELSSF